MLIRVGLLAVALAAVAAASAGAVGSAVPRGRVSQQTAASVRAPGTAAHRPSGAVPNVLPPFTGRIAHMAPAPPKATATPPTLCRTYGAADGDVRCEIVTCQYVDSDCVVYTTAGKVLATLNGLANPQGVASDRQNNAYIANTGLSNILKYSRGLAKLEQTYQDPGQFPADVDADAPAHLLAVSNIQSTSSGSGSVSVYADGATSPTANLTDPAVGFAEGIGIAIDRAGNCFWSFNDEDNNLQGEIDEFKGCAGLPKRIVSGLGFAGGVAFDESDALYYTDQIAGALYKCAKGKCVVLTTGFSDPLFINFDDRWKFLWVADYGAATVDAVDRTTGLIVATFPAVGGSGDPPFGVAHAPGPLY